jgi:hypothetical protein
MFKYEENKNKQTTHQMNRRRMNRGTKKRSMEEAEKEN